MGFTYAVSNNGRQYLCCDFCGKSKINGLTVRKIRCPFRWCQAYATCQNCKHLNTKEAHIKNDCDIYAKFHDLKDEFKNRKLNDGLFLNVCNDTVQEGIKATFKDKNGKEIIKIVTEDVYNQNKQGWFWFISGD